VAAAFANEPTAEFPEGLIHGVLDGGQCAVGVESSVVGWIGDEPVLWRAGGVSLEALEETLGTRPLLPAEIRNEGKDDGGGGDDHGVPASPGALPWHYAPRTPLRLLDGAYVVPAGERAGLLTFGIPAAPGATGEKHGGYARIENLSPAGDLREAAANLFAALHRLDASGLEVIHARLTPEEGLGRAINERLRKAAAAPGNR
jgi:L-threonylcarbamoyladenylate synthase